MTSGALLFNLGFR